MSKKKSKRIAQSPNNFASRISAHMSFRELQRANIVRGQDFAEMVASDFHQLQSWFLKHGDNSQNLSLLNEYDEWMKQELIAAGYDESDPIHHPTLRLGFVAEQNEEGEPTKTKRITGKAIEKPAKKKRERLEGTNVMAGTKKATTYKCALEGYSLEKTIETVTEAFGEVNLSSIKNWFKRAIKDKENA